MPGLMLNAPDRFTCTGVPPLDCVTVRLTVVLWVRLPDVPVTVTVEVPVVAVLLAEKVNVLVPVVLPGLNEAVTPLGSPEADRLTLPVNPFSWFTAIVLVPLAPWVMLRLPGAAERLKLGGGGVTVPGP